MIPSIVSVSSVEIIRDGGSLAAIFYGQDGCEYWLFFRFIRDFFGTNSSIIGYMQQVNVDRLTGIVYELSWEHALIYLRQIFPFLNGKYHKRLLRSMEEIALSSGQLPTVMPVLWNSQFIECDS